MPAPCQFCGNQTCSGIAGECPARDNEWDDSCEDEGCPECGDERWVEDDSDPINDGPDYPIIPCPLCNPNGIR